MVLSSRAGSDSCILWDRRLARGKHVCLHSTCLELRSWLACGLIIRSFLSTQLRLSLRSDVEHWLLLGSAKENWFRHRDECQQYLRQALPMAETTEIRRPMNRIAELWQKSECRKEGDLVGPCKQWTYLLVLVIFFTRGRGYGRIEGSCWSNPK